MASKMIPNPLNAALAAKGTSTAERDEPGDISESPEQSDMQYIKDFVANLDDAEFNYLQDCIAAKLDGRDKPEYKDPDKVKEEMDSEDEDRGATVNDSDKDGV